MEQTKFWDRLVKALPIIGGIAAIVAPTTVSIAIFFSVLSMNNEMRSEMAALGAQLAAQGAAIEALSSDLQTLRAENRAEFRELGEEIDALSADVVELKIGYAETNGRLDSIEIRLSAVERRLPDVESMDDRLDDLEREQATLKERVDALASADAE